MFLAGQTAAEWIYLHLGSAGFDQHVQTQQSSGFALSLLVSLLVAPIVEETLFRGLLYPMLRKRTGAVVAAVLSSLLFAAMHGNAVQAVAVIPLGSCSRWSRSGRTESCPVWCCTWPTTSPP
ncbi:CAAX amino terminal protease family protein [Arthrobacter sp. Hiyo8]|nr:CAAX amino terminal protease family protein [Arthrobacter sp. Hiyo8]